MANIADNLMAGLFTRLSSAYSSAGQNAPLEFVPEDATGAPTANYPYARVSALYLDPYDADDQTGYIATIDLDIWSRYKGMAELNAYYTTAYDALHRQPTNLTVTGAKVVDILQAGQFRTRRDPGDTSLYFGTVKFNITLVVS